MSTEIPLKNAPKSAVKVAKTSVTMPSPYKEGHKLRSVEADALNAYYHQCVRSHIYNDVKEAFGDNEPDPSALQKMVDDAVAEFDFGMSSPGRSADPVEQEAKSIAAAKVKEQLQKHGHKLSDVPTKEITAKAKELLGHEKYGKMIRDKARQIVEQRQSLEFDI